MLSVSQLEELYKVKTPVLTAYVRTDPVEAERLGGSTAASPAWGREESEAIRKTLPSAEQKMLLKQVERAREFLKKREAHEKSVVIVAGAKTWEAIPLQLDVQPGIHWGKPALAQLIGFASEHRRYGLVVVDSKGARLFDYWVGEIVEREDKRFTIDTSRWKRKEGGHAMELGHAIGSAVGKSRGSQRDALAKRMDNQFARLARETARDAAKICARERLAALFLIGSERMTRPMEAKLPKNLGTPVVLIDQDLAGVTLDELKKHIEPKIAEWEHKHENDIVRMATSEERGTIAGFDETLAQLQKGKIRTVVVARGSDPEVHQCVKCGWADRSADPVCPQCGGARRSVRLWEVLPELARKQGVEIDVVSNEAAGGLKAAEGMAGWLRQPKRTAAKSMAAKSGR
jgi:rubrerythrin